MFTLTKLPFRFADLTQKTRQLTWSQALPEKLNFYYQEHEQNELITVDDQESFEEAVRYNIEELNSHVMRL